MEALELDVKQAGENVKQLKTANADKTEVDAAVADLLAKKQKAIEFIVKEISVNVDKKEVTDVLVQKLLVIDPKFKVKSLNLPSDNSAAAPAPAAAQPKQPKAAPAKKVEPAASESAPTPAAAAVEGAPTSKKTKVSEAPSSSSAAGGPPLLLFPTIVSRLTGFNYDGKPFYSVQPSNGDPAVTLSSGVDVIAKYISRVTQSSLYPSNNPLLQSEIDDWIAKVLSIRQPDALLPILNERLLSKTYLCGHELSLADCCAFAAFGPSCVKPGGVIMMKEDESNQNVYRWLKLLVRMPEFNTATGAAVAAAASKVVGNVPEVKTCPPLEGAVMGQVVTRFPPEPSGHLHIGHMKAIFLNDYYARFYGGKLLVRFDDTNPEKEKVEYEHGILEDLATLEIKPDAVSWTSDHFETIFKYSEQLIKDGLAYVDDTDQKTMQDERMERKESKCRNKTVAQNLKDWELMKNAREIVEKINVKAVQDALNAKKAKPTTATGAAAAASTAPPPVQQPEEVLVDPSKSCLRAKIDMTHGNATLRDPVFARVILDFAHARTKKQYSVYPTYDFACPIVDSIEGVTHAMRDTNYNERQLLYQWCIKNMNLREVKLRPFGRLNFNYTVLSKRHLGWMVNEGLIPSWDDPRFPTIKGILRRGMNVEALREFMLEGGASQKDVNEEWDKFWAINRKKIDPVSYRYLAVGVNSSIPVRITNVTEEGFKLVPKIPADADGSKFGFKSIEVGPIAMVEREDCTGLKVGDTVALTRWGVLTITEIEQDNDEKKTVKSLAGVVDVNGDYKSVKAHMAWVARSIHNVQLEIVEYDWLITKKVLEKDDDFKLLLNPVTEATTLMIGNGALRLCQHGQIIQLERRGYMRVDRAFSAAAETKPIRLILIPDGKQNSMSTLSTVFAHR